MLFRSCLRNASAISARRALTGKSSEYSIDGGARRARSFPDEGRTGGFAGKLTDSCINSYCKWLRHYNFVPGMQLPSPFQTLKDMATTEEIVSAQDAPAYAPAQFVRWFSDVAPYVHDFRGKTLVIAFGGELVGDGAHNALVEDLSLLSALGVKLILSHGTEGERHPL